MALAYDILIYPVLAFVAVYFSTPLLIGYLYKINICVLDRNKKNMPAIPISGGLAVLSGILLSLFIFIFFRKFFAATLGHVSIFADSANLVLLFAALLSIFIITLVGFLDDLVIPADKSSSAGLRQWQKPLLTLTAAIPLMVVSAGTSYMWFPFLGRIEFGLLYPLVLIPLGVVGAANMVNLLAGLNGLETGMGLVYIGMLGLYAYVYNRPIAALIALVSFASLHGRKIYSLTHLFLRTGKFTEKQIVYSFMFIELLLSSLIWVI